MAAADSAFPKEVKRRSKNSKELKDSLNSRRFYNILNLPDAEDITQIINGKNLDNLTSKDWKSKEDALSYLREATARKSFIINEKIFDDLMQRLIGSWKLENMSQGIKYLLQILCNIALGTPKQFEDCVSPVFNELIKKYRQQKELYMPFLGTFQAFLFCRTEDVLVSITDILKTLGDPNKKLLLLELLAHSMGSDYANYANKATVQLLIKQIENLMDDRKGEIRSLAAECCSTIQAKWPVSVTKLDKLQKIQIGIDKNPRVCINCLADYADSIVECEELEASVKKLKTSSPPKSIEISIQTPVKKSRKSNVRRAAQSDDDLFSAPQSRQRNPRGTTLLSNKSDIGIPLVQIKVNSSIRIPQEAYLANYPNHLISPLEKKIMKSADTHLLRSRDFEALNCHLISFAKNIRNLSNEQLEEGLQYLAVIGCIDPEYFALTSQQYLEAIITTSIAVFQHFFVKKIKLKSETVNLFWSWLLFADNNVAELLGTQLCKVSWPNDIYISSFRLIEELDGCELQIGILSLLRAYFGSLIDAEIWLVTQKNHLLFLLQKFEETNEKIFFKLLEAMVILDPSYRDYDSIQFLPIMLQTDVYWKIQQREVKRA